MTFLPFRIGLALCSLALLPAAKGDTVRLATGNYPPYEFVEQGRSSGLAVELLREAFRRSHHTLDIVFLPWARALVEAQSGHVDGVFCTIATHERKASFQFAGEALVGMRTSLFVVRDAPILFKG
ncbi:MAG: transporter substrate-binding domain-containing protein [Pseudomonadota bacterium]